KMFFGPLANPKNKNLPDLNARESIALAPIIALIFVIGLFPSIFLDRMRDGVSTVIDSYVEGRKAYQEMDPEAQVAMLRPRKGGVLETGYPEPPKTGEAAGPKPTEAPRPAALEQPMPTPPGPPPGAPPAPGMPQ